MTQLPSQASVPEVETYPPTVPAPPKWSVSAILGFILSFLLVLAPIGVLLGVVGIVRTWGGKRRGMGLAVAAIPVGVVVSSLVALLCLWSYAYFATMRQAMVMTAVLETSTVRVPDVAAEFYDARNRRFQSAVTKEEFQKWVRGVIETHGSLQSLKRPQNMRLIDPDIETGNVTFNFIGEFVNGPVHIAVTMAPPTTLEPELRNISVEGVSAIPDPEVPAAEDEP